MGYAPTLRPGELTLFERRAARAILEGPCSTLDLSRKMDCSMETARIASQSLIAKAREAGVVFTDRRTKNRRGFVHVDNPIALRRFIEEAG